MVRGFHRRTFVTSLQGLTFASFFFGKSIWFESFRKTVALISGSA